MQNAFELRVLIAANQLLVRTGLAALLASQADIQIAGQIAPLATDTEEAILALQTSLDIYQPDVTVIDLEDDPAASFPAVTTLVDAQMPLVALLPDAAQVRALTSIIAGEVAYALLPREIDAAQLAQALAAVEAGLVVFDPELAAIMIPDRAENANTLQVDDLTPREYDVLQLMAQGLSNKAIALRLEISPNTVKFHVNAILSKLYAESRTEAVMLAARQGLIVL